MNTFTHQPAVAAQIAALPTLSTAELWALWDQHFPKRPTHANRAHMESRLTYAIQAQAYGGLNPATRQKLIAIGQRHSNIKTRTVSEFTFAPGTLLVREWADQHHRVTVTADGQFEYAGAYFKSLSAVARHITGTQWSGPVFFGLRKAGART